jgi:hypothetical protein
LAPADGLPPGTVAPPPPAAAVAEGAPSSDPPPASLEASVLEPPELDAFEFPVSELGLLELDVSADPPPHPVSARAATASARKILALAVLVDPTRRR